MFRRHWSGLPEDASFPANLKDLGYFVNDDDEIRSIQDPNSYFKFFLNKNERVNNRQRFEFNRAMEKIIHDRLEKEGMHKKFSVAGSNGARVPYLASDNLANAFRIVLIFGESTQDLGLLAGRVANGPGGLDKGSLVSVVRALQAQRSAVDDPRAPGIIAANMGQLYWWSEGKRALTITASSSIPHPSLVHAGRRYVPALNDIWGHETPEKHVEYIFDQVSKTKNEAAALDLMAIGDSCEVLQKFLDEKKNWDVWGPRLSSILWLGSVYSVENLRNQDFKEFMQRRTRGYIVAPEPLDTPAASPAGNPNIGIPPLGCPCYSSSEPYYIEMVLIRALNAALSYMQDVALTPGYENAPIIVTERPDDGEEAPEVDWEQLPEEQKPSISTADAEAMKEEIRQMRRWRAFEKTGEVPDSDEEELIDFEFK